MYHAAVLEIENEQKEKKKFLKKVEKLSNIDIENKIIIEEQKIEEK